MAYSSLEPGPYWPETGQAHTTCSPELLFVAAGSPASVEIFLATRVAYDKAEENAGIAPPKPSPAQAHCRVVERAVHCIREVVERGVRLVFADKHITFNSCPVV